jgi:hypothetical protein
VFDLEVLLNMLIKEPIRFDPLMDWNFDFTAHCKIFIISRLKRVKIYELF